MPEPEPPRRPLLLLGIIAVAAVAAIVLASVALRDDEDVAVEGSTTSSTTTTEPTTTAPTPTSNPPVAGGIDAATPLGPRGIGPIEAGMTVREAEQVSELALTSDGSFADFGGHCYFVALAGQPDLSIMVFSPGDEPVGDPRDGIIASVSIYAEAPTGRSQRTTTVGLGLGATEERVRATHGENAVAERPHDYVPDGAYLYVLPNDDPGFGTRYVLDEHRVVTKIDVGDDEAIKAPEGCA